MGKAVRARQLEGEFRYRHPIEIRYGDTDALGHVNNAVYLSYFEAARGGYYTAVVGPPLRPRSGRRPTHLRHRRGPRRLSQPAFYGEPLSCWCRVGWVGRSSFGLEYRVEVAESAIGSARLIADGSTVQVFYDLVSGRVMRMPASLLASLTAYEGRELPTRPGGA